MGIFTSNTSRVHRTLHMNNGDIVTCTTVSKTKQRSGNICPKIIVQYLSGNPELKVLVFNRFFSVFDTIATE